jgi:DNA helicase-2/ATP-dependent DNA helicase PcrA
MAVGDIAGAVRAGKVVLTTYHSAKGREWDFVTMPGLIDGILPLRQWSASIRRHLPAPPDKLEQDRRAFYVGLTRAKKAAILIYGDHWETPWGAKNRYSISPYASAVLQRIAAA